MDDVLRWGIEDIPTGLEVGFCVGSWTSEAVEAKSFCCGGEIDAETIAQVVQEVTKVETL